MTMITSGRSSTPKVEMLEMSYLSIHQDKDKLPEIKKPLEVVREETEHKVTPHDQSLPSFYSRDLNQAAFWQPQFQFSGSMSKKGEEKKGEQGARVDDSKPMAPEYEQKDNTDSTINSSARWMGQTPSNPSSQRYSNPWPSPGPSNARFGKP